VTVVVGIGMDLIDIERVERLLHWKAERALRKLFTDGEVAYASGKAQPARHYAARLAAKEATFKALAGNDLARTVGWRDIEVVIEEDGRPTLRLLGRARERAAQLGVTRVVVSLTHAESIAGAMVLLERD
jgi:holo-[acyl-carrier protein] synthase